MEFDFNIERTDSRYYSLFYITPSISFCIDKQVEGFVGYALYFEFLLWRSYVELTLPTNNKDIV